jgi:hypothetical protein
MNHEEAKQLADRPERALTFEQYGQAIQAIAGKVQRKFSESIRMLDEAERRFGPSPEIEAAREELRRFQAEWNANAANPRPAKAGNEENT